MATMPALQRTVCNINFFLKLRLCFGYYSDIFKSSSKRFVMRILLLAWAIMCVAYRPSICNTEELIDSSYITINRNIEYLAYAFCALQSGDQYIVDYFTVDPQIDCRKYKNIYRKIPKSIFIYVIFLLTGCTIFFTTSYFFNSTCDVSLRGHVPLWYAHSAIEIGFLPLVMIFLLFDCRVKIFCLKVREEVIESTSLFEWRKHLLFYVGLKNSLKKTDWPLKFMMFLHTCTGFIKILNLLYNIIIFKQNLNKNQEYSAMDVIFISNWVLGVIFNYLVVFLPSIIFEMAIAKLERLRIDLADCMLMCTDVNRRQNLLQLLRNLREQPLKYTLWRAVEVNVQLPLAFLALSATFLVCVLQLSHALD